MGTKQQTAAPLLPGGGGGGGAAEIARRHRPAPAIVGSELELSELVNGVSGRTTGSGLSRGRPRSAERWGDQSVSRGDLWGEPFEKGDRWTRQHLAFSF